MTGVEGVFGLFGLYEFVKSLIEHHHHPSWGWLCVVLAVAFFAELRVAHSLLKEEVSSDEPKISAKAHAHAMAEFAKQMGEPKG